METDRYPCESAKLAAVETPFNSEHRFRQLFEQASDAAFVHDAHGRFIDVNDVACASLGYTYAELLNLGVGDIDPTPDPTERFRFWQELDAGSVEKFETVHRRKDGSTFPVEIHASVLKVPEGRYLLALVRNITERTRHEELLRARVRQQEAVARLGSYALGSGGIDALLREAVAVVGDTLGIDMCRVYEHLPEQGVFAVRASLQFGDRVVGQIVTDDRPEGLAGYLLRSKSPVIVEDVATETRFKIPAAMPTLGVKSSLGVVIGGANPEDRCYGLLGLGHRELRGFTKDDVFFVQSVANILAAVIERRRQEDDLRAVEAKYQRIAAHTPGVVYQFLQRADGTFAVPFISESCRTLYGRDSHEIQANPRLMIDSIHPEDRPSFLEAMHTAKDLLTPLHWQGRHLLTGGEVRWMRVDSRPERLPDGGVICDGIIIDITEEEQRKQALQRSEERLRLAKEEAERANRAKSEFLSRISHKLRTPLNAILGFGQLLELSELNEQDRLGIGYILKGGRHLLGLVDEVLDLARVEAGKLVLESSAVDCGRLVQECVDFVVRLAQVRAITCTVDTASFSQVMVQTDEQRLRQVLLNLLSNAIKYNHVGGQVHLSCGRTPAGQVRVSVQDTGPGITPDGLTRLFVPFERLGQEYNEIEGSGLGLAVSKSLVEAMGGCLGVESQVGRGSTFWVDLPETQFSTSVPFGECKLVRPFAEPDGTVAKSVLYIEDNPSNLQLVRSVIGRLRPHWRFESATDGIEGLRLARDRRPGVVLLDLQLPGLAGDAVLAALRADPATARLPILLLSADATLQSRERLLALGANDYITKPFNVAEVIEKIDTLFQRVS